MKPCPFCGGTDLYTNEKYVIPHCDCLGEDYADSGFHIEIWNTRPIEEQLRAENERLRAFYPRAFKLMDKSKYFIVISFDEPYFIQAYSLIREQEIKKGRWDADDEAVYQYYAEQALKGGEK